MKLKRLWSNKSKVNKVIFYNFDFTLSELNDIIKSYYKKYCNVIHSTGENAFEFSLKFTLSKTESKNIVDNFEINFDYIDFNNYSKFLIRSFNKSITNQFAIINLKFDYLNFFNGVLGLLDEYYQQFCNHDFAPLFLIDVLISDEVLIQLNKLNSLQLTDNQLFHSIIFSPSESSENILQKDLLLYKIVLDLRFFLSYRTIKHKQQYFICGTLLYFTFNNKLNMQNFIYYCNKHINSKSSLKYG